MKSSLFKNTIIIGIGTICTKLLAFFMVPFYTRWLLPTEYGEYDLIVSYLSLVVPIITFQLEQAVFKWCLTKNIDKKKVFYNGVIVIIANIIIVNILCILFLKGNFLLPFMLYFDSYALYVLLAEYLRGNNKLSRYSLYNISVSLLTTILSFIFVPVLNLGKIGLLLAFGISYLLIDLIILITERLFSGFKKEIIEKKIITEMIKYSTPLIPNAISWWITNASDRTMIKIIIGNFYNGLYAVSCKIPTIISLVYGIFNLSWQQEAIITYNEADKESYYNQIFNKLISFLFCSGFIIIGLIPVFFKYFISIEYIDAMYITPYLIVGTIFLSLAQFLGGILLAQGETKKIGYTTVIAAIINLLINLFLMEKYGLIIAGISTMVSYIYFFIRRYKMVKIVQSWKHIRKIIIYVLILTLVIFVSFVIENILINIVLIITLSIFFFLENKMLIKSIIEKFYKFKNR